MRARFPEDSLESQVTLSLDAISIDGAMDADIETVIESAEAQLYQTKRADKDQVCAL